jgi:hypothetical protein
MLLLYSPLLKSDSTMIDLLLAMSGKKPASPEFVRVPSSEFITATALSTMVGMTTGSAVAGADAREWFLIKDPAQGKVVIFLSRPARSNVPWSSTFSTLWPGKEVTIAGCLWRCRLMQGELGKPLQDWDRYIGGSAASASHSTYPYRFAELTNDELGFIAGDPGIITMVVPVNPTTGQYRTRGNAGNPMAENFTPTSDTFNSRGWRPFLEYISGPLPW